MKISKRRRRLILLTLVLTCLVVGVVVFKKLTKKPPQVKSIVTIQICTLSDADTASWQNLKKVSLDDVDYLIEVKQKATVEELFQSLIDEGLAYGYGVDETSVASYNDNIGDEVINSKGSRLLGIKSIGVSDTNFMVADFDYGSKMLNQQKKDPEPMLKKFYQAYQKAQKK